MAHFFIDIKPPAPKDHSLEEEKNVYRIIFEKICFELEKYKYQIQTVKYQIHTTTKKHF